jgi:hypothetical protein
LKRRKGDEPDVISLGDLPLTVATAIREKARREHLTVEEAVIKLLVEVTGTARQTKRAVHHDLDRFFGTWTKEEADAFDDALREQRQVEPERPPAFKARAGHDL